jgi:hypothetical protein
MRDSHLTLPLSTLILAVLWVAPASAGSWQDAERLTTNGVEDRTTTGSLANYSFGLTVVWMQAQASPGWRIMATDWDGSGFLPPAPVDPSGPHPDFEPRVTALDLDGRSVVWQRGTGNAAEIMYASGPGGGGFAVEPITANATEDITPDIAVQGGPHVVWAGYDPISGTGKIFHAVRDAGGWQIERLAGSELGPFWTGAAPKVAVNYSGIVHVVYRGGDFGDYHAHYARKENGVWTYRTLTSLNANDLVADVATNGFDPVVAMSGNDGFGFPNHIYVRESNDRGLTFQGPQLASGAYSASLANVTRGPVHGIHVSGSEVSGNIYTGNLTVWGEFFPGTELLPPANQASETPCIDNAPWIVAARNGSPGAEADSTFYPGYVSCAYTNDGGAGAASAEIYLLSTPISGAVGGESAPPVMGAELRVSPNPTRGAALITARSAPGAARAALSIHDAAGRLVRMLDSPAGATDFRWDGRAANGRPVTAGVYFLRLEGAPGAEARLTVVRQPAASQTREALHSSEGPLCFRILDAASPDGANYIDSAIILHLSASAESCA